MSITNTFFFYVDPLKGSNDDIEVYCLATGKFCLISIIKLNFRKGLVFTFEIPDPQLLYLQYRQ